MLHFISGLPRSGSTLLAAILKQNSQVVAGMTSPLSALYKGIEDVTGANTETSVFITDEQRQAILKGLFVSYYGNLEDKIVFDTSRMWTARLQALSILFPEAKMICCVRDVGWIMDSFERVYRKNPFQSSGVYGYDTSGTVYSRTGTLAASNGAVGYAMDALREACASPQRDGRLMLIEYDTLCAKPKEVIDSIYGFIGAEPFAHDFENVTYEADAFDKKIGAEGLHEIKKKVEKVPRESVLPRDLFNRFSGDQFWRDICKETK